MCKINNKNKILLTTKTFFLLFGFLFLLSLINSKPTFSQSSASATYTAGHISTDRNFTSLPGASSCPGQLTVTIPIGAVITSIDVQYDMTASGGGRIDQQRSQLRCTSLNGTSEATLTPGVGTSGGTFSYSRTGLSIANNVQCGGDIIFELHAGRTSNSNDCNNTFNRVDNNTWRVTVNYMIPDNDSEITNGDIADADSISAVSIAYGDRLTVFDVKFSDIGTNDGKPTVIEELFFTQGAANEFLDWSAFIAGASLYGPDLGEESGLEIYGVVSEDRITFTGISMITIPNFESETYQLRIWIRPGLSSTNDNMAFHFELSAENITTSLCTPSSSFGDFACESTPVALYFPRDENSALTEGDGDEPGTLPVTNANFGSRIVVLDFKLIDMGSGDGANTIIDEITFTQGSLNEIIDWTEVIDGATLYGPDLGEISGFEAFGVVESNEIRFYSPDMIIIDDDNEETYQLKIWLNSSILTIYDNMIIDFELDYSNIITSTKFSSLFGIGNVTSGGILLFPKNSTSTIIIGDSIEPSSILSTVDTEAERENVFNLTIKDVTADGFNTIINELVFVMAADNEIEDWSTAIAGASLYGPDLGEDTGSELFGTVNEDNITFSDTEIIIIEDNTDETYQLRIWLTDELNDCKLLSFKLDDSNIDIDTMGSRFGTFSIESPPIRIEFVKENEILLIDNNISFPASIASTANDFDNREKIFEFTLSDLGTDRFNIVFDNIIFSQGDSNKIMDWTNLFAGASIYGPDLGEITGSELIGEIQHDRIVFDEPSMINILEGDTEIYELRVWLNPDLSNINDNDTFDIKLDYTGLITAECNSSWIDEGIIESGPIEINIIATKLNFVFNEPPKYVENGVEFNVTVIAVDDNDNFDTDASFDIELALEFGTGNVSSLSGLAQILENGSYTWDDIIYDETELFLLNITSATLTERISDTIECVAEFAVVSEGDVASPASISSHIYNEVDRLAVFEFKLTDHGIADGMVSMINEIIIDTGDENEIADWTAVIAGATLFGPDLGEVSGVELEGVIESNHIVFSTPEMIVIEDGDEEIYSLKIWLNTDLSSISHNDKLDFKLHYENITVEDGTTIFGRGIAQSGGISVFIEPYKLIFDAGAPPDIIGYGSPLTVTVKVADENGNLNLSDVSTVLISKYSGIGDLSSDTGLTKTLINGTFTWDDIFYSNLGFFRIQASAPGLETAISDSIESLIDEDSEISLGVAVISNKISSLNTSYEKRQITLDINIEDKGTWDGLPTIISQIVISQGANNQVPDWTSAIEGASLFGPDLGEVTGAEITGAVDSAIITFDVNNIISIADGSSETYKLKIWLYQDLAGVVDNDSLDFRLEYTDITPKTLGSSYFGAGDISSGGVAIDIAATHLTFIKNQPPTIVGFSYNFVVGIQGVDMYGNLDKDANDLITLSLYQGTGVLSSPAPFTFTQLLSEGTYVWYETKYNMDEPFMLRVVSNTLTQAISDVILCKKCVRSSLYTLGDIDTDRDFTELPGSSNCPGQMSIFVPSFAIVTSTDVFYSMTTHATPGKKVEQRSQLRCVSPGGLSEAVLYEGSGAQGTQEYRRLNLDIANYVTPGIDYEFELHAGRTNKGSACGHSFNLVLNYTWTVCINYVILGVHWTGEIDTDWNNPYNWACEIVPSKYVDVYILEGTPNYPIISSSDAEARGLIIEDGASLTIENERTIDVYGDVSIDGNLDIASSYGKIAFKGNGSTANGKQIVSGSNLNFYNFTVETQAYVKLLNEMNISGDLLIKGTLEATNSSPINITGLSNNFLVESGGKFIPKLSTIKFTGKERQKIKGGTSTFYNIEINTSETLHQLVILDDITVSNKIYLKRGGLNLNRKTLTMNTSNTTAIDRGISDEGYIYAETEPLGDFASKVKWNIGGNVENYIVPFGNEISNYIPMGVELVRNNMGQNGYLLFSTYGTSKDNQPRPDEVLHLGDTTLGYATPDFMVDRYFYFDSYEPDKEQATARIEGYLNMSYLSNELDQVIEPSMMAQRYNTVLNTWADLLYNQDDYSTFAIHGYCLNTPIDEQTGIGKFRTSYIDTAQFFNVWVLSDFSIYLPIKLKSFEAFCNNNNVVINWTTATEINSHFFTVEKSIDGLTWVPIAEVESAHNSSYDRHYTIHDYEAISGNNYYRLKQTDYDGKYEYFNVVVANCGTTNNTTENISIYPNPVAGFLNINYYNLYGNDILIEVFDALGKLITQNQLPSIDGDYGSYLLNLNHFTNGVYFIKISSDSFSYYDKVVKQGK